MFEDALMESSGRIRTRRGWFSGVAAICNGSIVCVLLLWPLLHPASLPRQTLSTLLAAPAPPSPPPPHVLREAAVSTRSTAFANPLTPPRIIPDHIADVRSMPPPAADTGLDPLAKEGSTGSFKGLETSIGTAPVPQVQVERVKKPVISSGVMAGNKRSGADPQYPAIARAARIQGIVVIEATISKVGAIENLHVISGPPILAPAAEAAVRTWRYRPYMLNGEAVEVETTVRVIFNLGQ